MSYKRTTDRKKRTLADRRPPGNDERYKYLPHIIPWTYKRHPENKLFATEDPDLRKVLDDGVEYCKTCTFAEVTEWIKRKSQKYITYETVFKAFQKKYGRHYFTATPTDEEAQELRKSRKPFNKHPEVSEASS